MAPRATVEKKEKDASAPKKPLTSYFLYAAEQRPVIQAASKAKITFGELAKLVGEQWKCLSEAGKEPYVTKASQAKAAYTLEFDAYILANPQSITAINLKTPKHTDKKVKVAGEKIKKGKKKVESEESEEE